MLSWKEKKHIFFSGFLHREIVIWLSPHQWDRCKQKFLDGVSFKGWGADFISYPSPCYCQEWTRYTEIWRPFATMRWSWIYWQTITQGESHSQVQIHWEGLYSHMTMGRNIILLQEESNKITSLLNQPMQSPIPETQESSSIPQFSALPTANPSICPIESFVKVHTEFIHFFS